ncbi:hypothetical protein [Halogeometricum luteum]|uniref:SPW repeat-containing protein n=1 Tax=Halogeometricum luteum TaxID=2950537 RepID=A0ABU2G6M0_9EURY|nr:hypothetical protein [Halogeometricum sp. S3BR5-2]MDS0295954.1 hypothetical protein [Halogeometricum sp. S3BR5-2]
MMWQDLVFLAGNVFSIAALAPTLRDETSKVPLGTSLPSLTIGFVYGTAFLTMDMTYSALGALLTGFIWGLIALLRSPTDVAELVASFRRSSDSAPSASPPGAD